MKSTKTLLIATLAAGALLAGNSALLAQNATNPPPAGEHGPGMKGRPNLAKQLDLTEAQKPKVDAIMKSAMEKGRALREDTSLAPEEKKARAKVIHEETATQMKAVLTPEQFAKWQEISKRGPRMHPPGGPDAPKSTEAPPQN
jgi:Spy/CpxP family protein refolding chaperone